MERLENQPSEWDDHLLAQALESEQRREQEEQKLQEDEELKKLQVSTNNIDLIKYYDFHWKIYWPKDQVTWLKADRFQPQEGSLDCALNTISLLYL